MKNKMFIFWFANLKYFISTYPKYRKIKKNYTQEAYEEYATNYALYILKKVKVTYEIHGEENLINGGVFYPANHNSMFDSYFTYLAVKHKHSYFVAGDLEYSQKVPMLGNFMKWANCIYVDRLSLKSGFKSIKKGEEQLKKNNNLIIFPEGEITSLITDDIIGEFHSGSFKAAKNNRSIVIPLTIIGSNKIHSTDSLVTRMSSAHVKIIIGKPIYDFVDNETFTTKQMSDKVRSIIIENLQNDK